MKKLHSIQFLLFIWLYVSACSLNKITEVSIRNDNDFPVRVTMVANNIRQTFPSVDPHAEWKGQFDWTEIEKKDGEWIVFVKNEKYGGTDSFAHGYFTAGELAGYAELICKGSQLKIKISE